MNQLSWLLYWGNVAGNLGQLFGISGVILLFAGCGVVLFASSSYESLNLKWAILPFCLSFILWFGAALMPNQTTVYAIAASQMGEQALKSPIVGKAGQALTAWLDKQIATTDKDKSQ